MIKLNPLMLTVGIVFALLVVINFLLLNARQQRDKQFDKMEQLISLVEKEQQDTEKLQKVNANLEKRVLPQYAIRGVLGLPGERSPVDFNGLVVTPQADHLRLDFTAIEGDAQTISRLQEMTDPGRFLKVNLVIGSGRSVFMLHGVTLDPWRPRLVVTGRCFNITALLGDGGTAQAARK